MIAYVLPIFVYISCTRTSYLLSEHKLRVTPPTVTPPGCLRRHVLYTPVRGAAFQLQILQVK
jgi:hypothetical protein